MYIYRLAWIISTLISLGLSFGLTRLLVYLGDTVIPSRVVLSSLLWALSSLLLLYSIKEFLPYRFYDFKAQQHHVTNLYKKYQKRYSAHLEEAFQKDVQLRRLFFAILVTEDLNRPLVFRTFERLFFRFGFINTTGIMQVTSPRKLSDRKSVELAQNMILGSYNNHRVNEKIEYMLVRAVAFDYNNGDFYRELIVDTYYNLKAYDATLE